MKLRLLSMAVMLSLADLSFADTEDVFCAYRFIGGAGYYACAARTDTANRGASYSTPSRSDYGAVCVMVGGSFDGWGCTVTCGSPKVDGVQCQGGGGGSGAASVALFFASDNKCPGANVAPDASGLCPGINADGTLKVTDTVSTTLVAKGFSPTCVAAGAAVSTTDFNKAYSAAYACASSASASLTKSNYILDGVATAAMLLSVGFGIPAVAAGATLASGFIFAIGGMSALGLAIDLYRGGSAVSSKPSGDPPPLNVVLKQTGTPSGSPDLVVTSRGFDISQTSVVTQSSAVNATVVSNSDGSMSISYPNSAQTASISADRQTVTYSDSSANLTQTAQLKYGSDASGSPQQIIQVASVTKIQGIPVAVVANYDPSTGQRLSDPAVAYQQGADTSGITASGTGSGTGSGSGSGSSNTGTTTGTGGTGSGSGTGSVTTSSGSSSNQNGGGNCGGPGQVSCSVTVDDSGFRSKGVDVTGPSGILDGAASAYRALVQGGGGNHGIGFSSIFPNVRFGLPKTCGPLDLDFGPGAPNLTFDPCDMPLIQLFRLVEAFLLYCFTVWYCWRRFLSSELPVGA